MRQGTGIVYLALAPLLLTTVFGCQSNEPEPAVDDASSAAAFLDPVISDASHYALEFENEYVRVLRENLPAGAQGARHSHRDRISVYLNDAGVTIYPDEDSEGLEASLVAGSTSWGEATTHRGTAVDDIENISIELVDLDGEEVPVPEPDAVALDPEHHVVDFENEWVRVVRMTYPPGTKTPHHAHRIGYGVFLTDAHGQNIPLEGDAIPIDRDARSTFWTTGQPAHVTENLGDEDIVIVLVEMKKHPADKTE